MNGWRRKYRFDGGLKATFNDADAARAVASASVITVPDTPNPTREQTLPSVATACRCRPFGAHTNVT